MKKKGTSMLKKSFSVLLSSSLLLQGLSLPVLANESEVIEEMEEENTESFFSGGFFFGDSLYNSTRDSEVKPLEGTSEQKIAALRSMFPQGRYWNHPASDGQNYWPENTTNTPCTTHSNHGTGAYQCNFFDGMALCDGFAFLCFYKYHGQRPNSPGCEKVAGNQGIKVGDVIETHLPTDGPNGHISFVWKIVGNTLYKLEGNYAGNCKIWQSATVQVSDVTNHWTRATRTVSYEGNGGEGQMESHSYVIGDNQKASNVAYQKPGYVFMGWNVKDPSTGSYLYKNPDNPNSTIQFTPDSTPDAFGFEKVILQNGENLDRYTLYSKNLILTATWEKLSDEYDQMFRLYNPKNGEHFYTKDPNEYLELTNAGWKFENFGWKAPKSSNYPVYRIYNPNAEEHHYTMNLEERNQLVSNGWKDEGIGWYSADESGTPLYRQFNPKAKSGSHNYTTSKEENDGLVNLGWQSEGIAWYGLK